MKKDGIYLIGGLAVGAVLFYVFKDQIKGLTKSEKSSDEESSVPPVTAAGIGQIPQPSGSISGGYMNTGIGAPNEVMQGQTQQNQTSQTEQTQVVAEPILPYDLTEIDPSLRNSSAYTDLFGGCDFPIVDGAESICVQRVQDALDVDTTGLFDDPTQVAVDEYIEKLPNRSEHFGGFTRNGCIEFDPTTNKTTNVCGLNHDQYLDILFKMGIPLNETYDD